MSSGPATLISDRIVVNEKSIGIVESDVFVQELRVEAGGELELRGGVSLFSGALDIDLTVKGDYPVADVLQFTGPTGPIDLTPSTDSDLTISVNGATPGNSMMESIILIGASASGWGNDPTIVRKWGNKIGLLSIDRANSSARPYVLNCETKASMWGLYAIEEPVATPKFTNQQTTNKDADATDSDPMLSGGVVAAIVIAVIAFGAVIGGVAFYFVRKNGDAQSSSSSESSNFSSSESEQEAI
jgi:hypothetical protein